MKTMKVLTPILASLVLTTGCSTMYNSGSQTIMARSTDGQEGIKVEISSASGSYPAQLPATIAAEPSNTAVEIKVVDQCYDQTQVSVGKSVTPSYWANLLNGWGFLIDWATGKMWKYDSNVSVPVNKNSAC